MTTGQLIKKARQKAGITQQELADRLGISYVGVSQWETDKRNPRYETLVRIANALDIPVGYLYKPPSLRELHDRAIERHEEAYYRAESAKENEDEDSFERWEEVNIELKAIKETIESLHQGDLPEDTEKLVEMFDSLNHKGRKRVLELVGDFCKIPEYQVILPQPQQEPSEHKQ